MFGMKLSQHPGFSSIDADFPDEPQPRRGLLCGVIGDMWNQEDLYLSYVAKAEAGETTLDLYNNCVNLELHADGRVIIEELPYDEEEETDHAEPPRTQLTLGELKQLILDWLDAKAKWRAEHGPRNEGTVPESR